MTKRHLVALAAQLKAVRKHFTSEAEWLWHCQEIAAICACSNRAFDRSKFLRACGVV